MKVYFISGLGADSRVFRHIHVPAGHEAVFLDWISPLKKESLCDYSCRLSARIDNSEKFSLVGLSLGGMVATEIAERMPPQHLILISSISASGQLPSYYRMAGFCRLHYLVPVFVLQRASILKRMFSSESDEDKHLLRSMIRQSDPRFIRWALNAILQWKKASPTTRPVHIHGSRDMILPRRFTKPTHVINGAGHLMVMNRAEEINRVLEQVFIPGPLN